MNNFVTLLSFSYPHEAHIVKAKLESEGIEVFLIDELISQVHNFNSNAFGGVKLQVRASDFMRAQHILIQMGKIKLRSKPSGEWFEKLDQATSKLPIIGKVMVEVRIAILATLIIFGLLTLALLIFGENLI